MLSVDQAFCESLPLDIYDVWRGLILEFSIELNLSGIMRLTYNL